MSNLKRDENRLTVAFDFDGVITEYKNGWLGVTEIDDKPVKGIKEAIDEIIENYKVIIVSHRCKSEIAKDSIRKWLDKNKIQYDDITNEMPHNIAYIDDRGIMFNGNTKSLLKEIENLEPWHLKADTVLDYDLQPGDMVEFEIFKDTEKYIGEIRFEYRVTNHINANYNNSIFYKIRSNFNSYDIPYDNIIRKVR